MLKEEIRYVEVFQLVLDRVVDQAGGQFKGVLQVADDWKLSNFWM